MIVYCCRIDNVFSGNVVCLLDYYNLDYIIDIVVDAVICESLTANSGEDLLLDELDIESVFYIPTLNSLEELKRSIGGMFVELFNHFKTNIEMYSPGLMVALRNTWTGHSTYHYGLKDGDLQLTFHIVK